MTMLVWWTGAHRYPQVAPNHHMTMVVCWGHIEWDVWFEVEA